MNTILLLIGNDVILDDSFNMSRFFTIMSDKGFEISSVITLPDATKIDNALIGTTDAKIIVGGDTDLVLDVLRVAGVQEGAKFFKHNDNTFFLMPEYDEDYIKNIMIPVLNSNEKVFYNTIIYNVFGLDKSELTELLSKQLQNRKLSYKIYYTAMLESSLHIRYSSNTSPAVINDELALINELLAPYVYAAEDISLTDCAIALLKEQGNRISIVETFTKGGLTYTLAQSKNNIKFCDSVICVNDKAICSKFNITQDVINTHGIISDETAYILAGSMLSNSNAGLSIAVVGNTPQNDEDEDCQFYIAVGDSAEIHVFSKHHFGTKQEVIDAGIKHALFAINKFIKKNN